MQTDPTKEIGGVFSRAWQLLSSNWIIVVPAIVIGVIAAVINALFFVPKIDPVSGTVFLLPFGLAIAAFISMLANILILTVTTGMADAAWKTGRTTLDDATGVLRRPNVTSAMGALIVVSIVLALLTIVSLGLLGIVEAVVFFFLIYTLAAAVHGGFGGTDALKASFEAAKSSWVTTLIVILLLAVVGFCAALVAAAFGIIPLLGPVIGGILSGVVVAFATLVIVGEYISIRPEAAAP